MDGHVNSLSVLLHHANFIKPYCDKYLLVYLLTTSMELLSSQLRSASMFYVINLLLRYVHEY